jgi:predicted metal-dependent peptidase
MIRDFLGEVKGIMEMFPQFRLGLATFDTKVYNYRVFSQENADEILTYEVKGGGGTAFEAVFDFMEENEIEPNTMVMFTDGYPCGTWGNESYCDTLFIIHGSDSIVPPFGSYAYYTDHKAKKRKA